VAGIAETLPNSSTIPRRWSPEILLTRARRSMCVLGGSGVFTVRADTALGMQTVPVSSGASRVLHSYEIVPEW